jgi:hypothetical protein
VISCIDFGCQDYDQQKQNETTLLFIDISGNQDAFGEGN